MTVSKQPIPWISRTLGISSLLISLATLPFALFNPMLTSSKFYFARNTFSVITGLQDLWEGGEYPLFILILLFCVCLPAVKLIILVTFWLSRSRRALSSQLNWIGRIGKWSMIDVYMCANLFVILKLGFTVNITLHNGLYFFAATIISSMISVECAIRWNRYSERLTELGKI